MQHPNVPERRLTANPSKVLNRIMTPKNVPERRLTANPSLLLMIAALLINVPERRLTANPSYNHYRQDNADMYLSGD